MNRRIGNEGYVMVGTIFALVIISILSVAVMSATQRNLKFTRIDSSSQSAYYIAEAGLNYIMDDINKEIIENNYKIDDMEELLKHIDSRYINKEIIYDDYEENKGDKPVSKISVELISNAEATRGYKITSIGEVGISKRKVISEIFIEIGGSGNDDYGDIVTDGLVMYTEEFTFKGGTINAPGGTLITDEMENENIQGGSTLNITNIYFRDDVEISGRPEVLGSKEHPGKILVGDDMELKSGKLKVYGDVHINGDFELKDAEMFGDVYVRGDVKLNWTPIIHKSIYYSGELEYPKNFPQKLVDKCIKVTKVPKFKVPKIDYKLKSDSWYLENGYVKMGDVRGKLVDIVPKGVNKILVDSYENKSWQDLSSFRGKDLVIVSKDDIKLRGGSGFQGALIAPEGDIEYSGDGVFTGAMISKEEIKLTAGGNTINFRSLKEIFGDKIPVIVKYKNYGESIFDESESGGEGERVINIKIQSGVKEK